MTLEIATIVELLAAYIWPFIRISTFVVALPAIGGAFVPRRIRALLAIVLTLLLAPLVDHDLGPMALFTLGGLVQAMQGLGHRYPQTVAGNGVYSSPILMASSMLSRRTMLQRS